MSSTLLSLKKLTSASMGGEPAVYVSLDSSVLVGWLAPLMLMDSQRRTPHMIHSGKAKNEESI